MELLLRILLFLLPPHSLQNLLPLSTFTSCRSLALGDELWPPRNCCYLWAQWFGSTIAYSSQHSSVEFLTARAYGERRLWVANRLQFGWMDKKSSWHGFNWVLFSAPRMLALRGGLPYLEHLNLSGCLTVTSAGLQDLVSVCPSLNHEHFYYCDNINGNVFWMKCLFRLQNLFLYIDGRHPIYRTNIW